MRKAFVSLLFFLLLTACAAVNLDTPVGQNPLVQATPVMADEIALQATERPSATMTATQVSTPTPDHAGTQQALEVALQQSLGTTTMEAVRELAVVKSATALQGFINGTATATVAKGHAIDTATVAYLSTEEQRAIRTQSAADTATVQAPITQKAQVDADFEPYFQMALLGGLILIVGLVLWFGAQVGYQWAMRAYEARLGTWNDLPAPVTQASAEPLKVQLDQRDKYGWGSVDFLTMPIDTETLHKVAALLTNGSRYTQVQMTGAGKPLVKDASFNTFGDWMVQYRIAAKVDGRYTITHPEFFEQVLKSK